MSRGRRWVPPAPGIIPSRISGTPIWAVSPANRQSAVSASSQPPPSAKPLIAAITGLSTFSSRFSASWAPPIIFATITGVASAISLMSAPAAKTFSPPVTTIARTPSSYCSSVAQLPDLEEELAVERVHLRAVQEDRGGTFVNRYLEEFVIVSHSQYPLS